MECTVWHKQYYCRVNFNVSRASCRKYPEFGRFLPPLGVGELKKVFSFTHPGFCPCTCWVLLRPQAHLRARHVPLFIAVRRLCRSLGTDVWCAPSYCVIVLLVWLALTTAILPVLWCDSVHTCHGLHAVNAPWFICLFWRYINCLFAYLLYYSLSSLLIYCFKNRLVPFPSLIL